MSRNHFNELSPCEALIMKLIWEAPQDIPVQELIDQLRDDYGKDYANDALRYALKNYENKLLIKNKLVKTAGGIVALALTLKPIYHYVQKTFIPKVVDPGINMFNKTIVDSSSLKQHIKN